MPFRRFLNPVTICYDATNIGKLVSFPYELSVILKTTVLTCFCSKYTLYLVWLSDYTHNMLYNLPIKLFVLSLKIIFLIVSNWKLLSSKVTLSKYCCVNTESKKNL